MDVKQFKPSCTASDTTDVKTGFAPVVGDSPEVLILGSLPGDKSLEMQEYYANRSNQFWKILSSIFNDKTMLLYSYRERVAWLKEHKIALWDVCKGAERKGSSDTNIKNASLNDIPGFLAEHPSIKVIGLNGSDAQDRFNTAFRDIRVPVVNLTSSSGLNTHYKFQAKIENWKRLWHNI